MDDEELIQIVDEHDNPIAADVRNNAWKKGLLHRIVYIMVESPEGRILLQLRGANMSTFPSCWDVSAAGHVDADEQYDVAAKRELFEELGIEGLELEEVGRYRSSTKFEWRKLERFNMIYRVVIPEDTKLVLQASELENVRWFSRDAVKALVRDQPDRVANGLASMVTRYY